MLVLGAPSRPSVDAEMPEAAPAAEFTSIGTGRASSHHDADVADETCMSAVMLNMIAAIAAAVCLHITAAAACFRLCRHACDMLGCNAVCKLYQALGLPSNIWKCHGNLLENSLTVLCT